MHDQHPPRSRAPALACDAHFHVFDDPARYPSAGALRYDPPHAPLSDYLALAGRLGIERYVFVQPSAYGQDNRCMLDAMRQVDPARCRGIVDIADDLPEAEWQALHAAGVRGIRINHSPIKPFTAGFAATLQQRIRTLDARCAASGWQLDFLGPGWLTEALLPTFAELQCNHSVAHLGMFLAKEGPQQRGFQALIELAESGARKTWIKLTGLYRISTVPNFADVDPMAAELIRRVPDRLIWGSDYPHLSFADKVGSVELFDKLSDWAPDEGVRGQILVGNPARLFGF